MNIDTFLYKVRWKFLSLLGRTKYPSDEEIIHLYDTRNISEIFNRIKNKDSINVAFFCMSVSLWKYETLFREMLKSDYFNPIFFIAAKMDVYKSMKKEIKMMEDYCKKMSFPCIRYKSNFFYVGQDLAKYEIDVAFYTQPYSFICCPEYYYDKLRNALLCYTPYGYLISKMEHNYVSILNKIVWKNYIPTSVSKKIALEFNPSSNNICDFGYLGYDMYQSCEEYSWGKEGTKKIIWAPHHSVGDEALIHLSSFFTICDYMLELAKKYENTISFAFKPHPYLYPTLCRKWGRKKTDAYYSKWKKMDNCISFDGNGYSLMKSSDAMIHDCASYLLDYIYTQNPCLYVSLTGKLNVETGQDGIDAYEAHYHANCKEDIERFIEDVLFEKNDTLVERRQEVLKKHILKANGLTTTQMILNDMTVSLQQTETEANKMLEDKIM